jgi:hypothetical protein
LAMNVIVTAQVWRAFFLEPFQVGM